MVGEVPVETVPAHELTTTTVPQTEPEPRACTPAAGGTGPVATGEVATDALQLSGEIFLCANEVVVVGLSDLNEVAAAAQLAAAVGAPLLFFHPRLAAEVGRLTPRTVHLVGPVEFTLPPDAEVIRHEGADAVDHARQALGVTREVRLPARPDSSTVVETVGAILEQDRVVLPLTQAPGAATTPEPHIDPVEVLTGIADLPASGSLWLVDAADPVTILMAAATGRAVGASVVALDFDDLLRHPEVGPVLAGHEEEAIRLVGSDPEIDDWKMRVLAGGQQLPGGGFELFPENVNRRFVAFYGNPVSPALGALGQASPQEILDLMRNGGELTGYNEAGCLPSPCRGVVPSGLLDGYAADGANVVPTFNYIASVAQPGCGTHLFPIETFEEGINTAAEEGGYVVFDLQPGSDNFLTHAQFYEEALRLPHVGLALDPEWRCGWPDQTEFDRIGTTTAAEINTVIEWLADLVNEEGLPQKLLIIQQFRISMIQDRNDLVDRKEVQVVIQMDGEGQGTLEIKDRSYDRVTVSTEESHWRWGWKNFFARDHPNGPYPPEETLDRDPVPVYISYQ